MENKNNTSLNKSNAYDDGNIPKVDLPQNKISDKTNSCVEPLPESSRPRKDGPAEIKSLKGFR